ncbi:MAG: ABC transporter ATP-binding protein [Methanophagales archaeon]|nr:ABC transporter ATP-binding protein [Methanophagales archaeon]
MSEPIIKVSNLSKRYRIGAKEEGYKTIREAIVDGITAPIRNLKRLRKLTKFDDDSAERQGQRSKVNSPDPMRQAPSSMQSSQDDVIWALKDVSFEVNEGEVLGIIGKNGAGKSTLLKILSRITEPTSGSVEINGRLSSLLEVGTGFHPELTGRENIFLNGAVLGMRKREIEEKFDEIVNFAEIEKFIDTPVKRYSSGMYVRLAFAVAAHLEPEVLLVDEVLAVGDIAFQKKCLGKMGEVARGGRTVLFVSHNMGAIRQLVSRCILVDKGKIIFDGEKNECISQYLHISLSEITAIRMFPDHMPMAESPVVIKCIALLDNNGKYRTNFNLGESLTIEILLESKAKDIKFHAMIQIQNELGVNLYHCPSVDAGKPFFNSGLHSKLKVTFPELMIYPGRYNVNVGVYHPGLSTIRMDYIEPAISFEVEHIAGVRGMRLLGKGDAVVHEVPIWEIEK